MFTDSGWLRTAAAVSVAGLLGLGLSLTGASAPAGATIPGDALVLQYEFEPDQIESGKVADLSARNLDGAIVHPDSAVTVDGRIQGTKALKLPGGPASSVSAAYVEIPNGLFEGSTAVTISAWVKWDGGPDFQWLYNLGKNQNAATFYTPSFQGDSRARSSIKPVNGNAEVGVSDQAKLPADSWQNVVTTIDGTTITSYLNGVKIGAQPATINVADAFYSGSNTTSGFIGRAFWSGHPFFDGAVDDFRVYNVALDEAQVAELSATNEATIESLLDDKLELTTNVGEAPELPATVGARYSDGVTRAATVTWNDVEPVAYAARGTFTVDGAVDGYDGTLTAHVEVRRPGELTVDLQADTGAFHGGASGTLYGIYGEDLPSSNLVEGINLRTVATKAQDGPQHPGADALEVVKSVADSSDGDVYIYMTDVNRGFPYQWEGDTPEEKLDIYVEKMEKQVDRA